MDIINILSSNPEVVTGITAAIVGYVYKKLKSDVEIEQWKGALKDAEKWGIFALTTLEELNIALEDDRLTKKEIKNIVNSAYERYSKQSEE